MTVYAGDAHTAPWWVTLFTPIAKRLLGAGVPLGFNGLITIRGRTSGEPRTIPWRSSTAQPTRRARWPR